MADFLAADFDSGDFDAASGLAGTSAGVATVTGTLTNYGNLVGSSDGVATVTGTLTNQSTMAGQSDGVATVTGTLFSPTGRLARLLAEIPVVPSAGGDARLARMLAEVAMTGTGTPNARLARIIIEVMLPRVQELAGSSDGVATVTGDLYVGAAIIELEGTSGGSSTVTSFLLQIHKLSGTIAGQATVSPPPFTYGLAGTSAGESTVWGQLNAFRANVDGVATVTGTLAVIHSTPLVGFPIPYPFLGGGKSTHLLDSIVKGTSTVTGDLSIIIQATGTSTGAATVVGALDPPFGPGALSASSAGVATVTGYLRVGQLDADGDFIIELAGTSAGSSTVTGVLFTVGWTPADPVAQGRYLYLLCNLGVSFDPTDDDSGDARFVSQTFLDGHVNEFSRYLYLLCNLTTSFDPTDDDSADPRFVSQVFLDGHVNDFNRYLYLLCNVILPDPVQYGQLTINEGFRGYDKALPERKPPGRGF